MAKKNKYFEKIFNENNGKYYLGLDIGTHSIGWAVHNEDNDIIDFGVYLDSNVDDNKEKREKRSARRNSRRRKYRLNMFENLAIDYKLIDSNLGENTSFKMYDSFFIEKREELGMSKKESLFPTIYHLKKKAINQKITKEDLFLVLYHSLKLRGHFLLDMDYDDLTKKLNEGNALADSWLETFNFNNTYQVFKDIIKIKNGFKKQIDIKKEINLLYDSADKNEINKDHKKNFEREILFIFGFSETLGHVEGIPIDDKGKVKKFKIEKIDEIDGIPEYIYELEKITAALEIKSILSENNILSEYMVSKYYMYSDKQEDGSLNDDQEENIKLFAEVNKDFVAKYKDRKIPYLRNFENRKFPNQLYYDEAVKIIDKQREYYPEVLTDEFEEKYKKLITSRIPYYVGPLAKNNEYSEFAWVNKKEKTTPYNISNAINHEEANEEFIDRMVKQDPYFEDEKVLPVRSYTYELYKVLSDLNNFVITVNSDNNPRHLTQKEKDILLERLYKQKENKSITKKKITESLVKHCNLEKVVLFNDNVSEKTIYANLKTYIELNLSCGLNLNPKQMDEFSKILTLFEDKELKKKAINRFLEENKIEKSAEEIKKINLLKYQGYGEYSHKFLNEYLFESEVEDKQILKKTLIDILRTEDKRVNEILAENQEKIANSEGKYKKEFENQSTKKIKLDYSLVEDMYGSNIVKSQLNNLFIVMNEMHKIYGIPQSVTIEMAREDEEKKQTKSREEQLKDQLKLLKNDKKSKKIYVDENFLSKMESYLEEGRKVNEKILLYYQQEGKDLYSIGEDGKFKLLDFDKIYTNQYDIDHIIPYSFNFDNSLNNKVLTHRDNNAKKNNKVPLDVESISKNKKGYENYINKLRTLKLISAKKRDNLLVESLEKYSKQGFKNSQLNDTRYITKEIVAIFKAYYDTLKELDESVNSVAINTLNASVIKPINNKAKIIKIRNITDKHHAIDAYLASIVYKEIKKNYSHVDSIKAGIIKQKIKENKKNEKNSDKAKTYKKQELMSNRDFVDKIYKGLDGENLIDKIDSKNYKKVYKIRKKVTGTFWNENYIGLKEKDGIKESNIATKLRYNKEYNDWKQKDKHKKQIDSVQSARIDIFEKKDKLYMFAVPKTYFIKQDNKIKINKEHYIHGLKVMNKEIWKVNEEITLHDFKLTIWKSDLIELTEKDGNELIFITGGANKGKYLEGKFLNERAFNLEKLKNLYYDSIYVKDRAKQKYNIFKRIYEENEEILFVRGNLTSSKSTIALKNIIIWYKNYLKEQENDINYDLTEKEKEYFESIYDTKEKQEISRRYFYSIIEKEKEDKNLFKEFKAQFKEFEQINAFHIIGLNKFQIIAKYNQVISSKNKQKRFTPKIQSKSVVKIVQSPLGHRQRKIIKEKFTTEFEIR